MPDVRRLLRLLALPPTERAFGCHWSRRRRRRQADARRSHHRRRLARSDPEVPL